MHRKAAATHGVWPRSLLAGVVLCAWMGVPAGAAPSADAKPEKVTLSIWPAKLVVQQKNARWCAVRVILTNNGDTAVYVSRSLMVSTPGVGAKLPLIVRATDGRGKPLEYRGLVYRIVGKATADSFIRLEPGYCYGSVINLSPLFPALRTPGSYTVWVRYENQTQPSGLPRRSVWVGETREMACTIDVQ